MKLFIPCYHVFITHAYRASGGHAAILELLLAQEGTVHVLALKNISQQTALDLAKNVECGALLQKAIRNTRPAASVEEEDPYDSD